ncbi:hypothetical protein ACF0H5_019373 [Mactra antiquata]
MEKKEASVSGWTQPPEGPDVILDNQSQLPLGQDMMQYDNKKPPVDPDMMQENQPQPPDSEPIMLDHQPQPPMGPDIMQKDKPQPPEGPGLLKDNLPQQSDGPDMMLDDLPQPPVGLDMMLKYQPPGGTHTMQNNQSQALEDPEMSKDDPQQPPEGPDMIQDDPPQPPEGPDMMQDDPPQPPEGPDMMQDDPPQPPEGPDMMQDDPPQPPDGPDMMQDDPPQPPEGPDMMQDGPDMMQDDPPQPPEGPDMMQDDPPQPPEGPDMMQDGPDMMQDDPPQPPEGPDMMQDDPPQPPEGPDMMQDDPPQPPEGPEMMQDDPPQPPEGPDMMQDDPPQPPEGPDMIQDDPPQSPEGPDKMQHDPPQPPEGPDMIQDDPPQPPEGPDMIQDDPPQPPEGPEMIQDEQPHTFDGPDMMQDKQGQTYEGQELILSDQPQPFGPGMIHKDPPHTVKDPHIMLDSQTQPLDGPVMMLDNPSLPPEGPVIMLQNQSQPPEGRVMMVDNQSQPQEGRVMMLEDQSLSHEGRVMMLDDQSLSGEGDETEANGHCRRVFVCSGSHKVEEQLKQLVRKCGGELVSKFQKNTTHVVMQADASRCCNRSLKYLMGIAHHCWILDHHYVEQCLKAGIYLPEEEYEIVGDNCFPRGLGASLSRQTKKKIFFGLKIRFSGYCDSFPKDHAEDIILSLGGEVDTTSSCVISINETCEPNTVSREWLFNCLSFFMLLKMDSYYSNDDEGVDTDDFIEDSCDDDDDDDDYIPLEESHSDSESTEYPIQDTITIFIEDSCSVTQTGGNIEQAERRKSSMPVVNGEQQKNTEDSVSVTQTGGNIEQAKRRKSSLPVVNAEQQTIHIATSKKTKDGKRIWDKKHVCIYCMNHYAKLARHLEQVHSTEFEVKKALAYDKNSAERKQVWRDIMNKGDFAHNANVLQNQKGEIIPFKRPSKVTDGVKYAQCESCLGTFLGSDLWRHVKKCHPDKTQNSKKLKRYHQISSVALLPFSSEAADDFREKILNRMTNDAISLIARNDGEIVEFGQKMFMKYAKNPHEYQYIRQKMRELARFLSYVRAANQTIETLRDCIDSTKFSVCVKAVRKLCGYNEDDYTFKVPSLAKKLGHSLHRVARQLKIKAAKTGYEDLKKKAKGFIEVYLEDWDSEVSHAALETLEIKKYNKTSRIPLAEDLKALSTHLKVKAEVLTKTLDTSDATEEEWRQLCEVTLAQVVLFNKRRSGEAERLEVKQYKDGIQHGKTNQEEVLQSLSPLEKQLAEVIDRVELRGKRGRRVAILLPDNLRKQLDILVNTRRVGHIIASNKYMFARAGEAEFPVRASDVLRKNAHECGAKRPELLNSTSFRKHIAVIVQMLNLKENELDVLAGFLGHDIRVHREFYRLPQDTMQIAKVSKLLMELEKGNIQHYKGKSLDEIQFDLEETLDDEEEEEEEENSDIATAEVLSSSPTNLTKCSSGKTTESACNGRKMTPEEEENSGIDEAEMAEASLCNSVTKVAKHSSGKKTKAARTRRKWTQEEEAAVKRQLNKYFFLNQLPGKCEIEEARKLEPVLLNRPWIQIKSFIKNKKVSMKRKQSAYVP